MVLKKPTAMIWMALQIFVLAVVALILLGNVYRITLQGVFKVKSPTVFGYSFAVVLTGSMSGTMEPDDVIITKSQSEYEVGDIITYLTGETPVTHRIVAEGENGYRTKGDANNTDDGVDIEKDKVVGKVVLILPKIGAVIRFLKTTPGFLTLFVTVILMTKLESLVSSIRQRDKKQSNERKTRNGSVE